MPGVDQVLDAGDLALNVWRVSTPEHRGDPEAWTNLALTGLGAAIPVVGDALEAGLKAVMRGGPRAASALAETPRATRGAARRAGGGARSGARRSAMDQPRVRPAISRGASRVSHRSTSFGHWHGPEAHGTRE